MKGMDSIGDKYQCTYAFLGVCNDDMDKYKQLLSDALSRARRESGRLIVISVLCPNIDYNKYLLTANEVTANNMDARVELYEVRGVEGAIKVFNLLSQKCAPVKVYADIDVKPEGVEVVKM